MSQKRLATFATTTSYQNAATLLAAISTRANAAYVDGTLRVALDAGFPVRISIVPGGSAGDDGLSNLFDPGEYLDFKKINLNNVWIKSVGGVSVLELQGDELFT